MGLAYPIVEDRLHTQADSPSDESVVGVDNRKRASLGGSKYLSMYGVDLGGLLGEANQVGPVKSSGGIRGYSEVRSVAIAWRMGMAASAVAL